MDGGDDFAQEFSHPSEDRGLQQFGVGREGDVLGLHRGVDADPGQIVVLQGAGMVGEAQGLGQELVEPPADALAPMAQAGALVANSCGTTSSPVTYRTGIMDPARPEPFVGARGCVSA